MKTTFKAFFILLTVNGLWAQADTLWTKTFGGSQYYNANSVQQTRDDGYIITGKTNSSGNGSGEIGLLKIGKYSDSVWHVSIAGSDSNDGSENSPFATIQKGIDSSSDGDTVLVAAGTYMENITWPATNGIKLIGSGEEECIIDGDSRATVIRFGQALGGIIDTTTVIKNFTIQNGYAQGDWPYRFGGGIHLIGNSSPSLENVTITGNSASRGGGISCQSSYPRLLNVNITGNIAYSNGEGGGISMEGGSSPHFLNVNISGNTAGSGGGISSDESTGFAPILDNVRVSNNISSHSGGGFYLNNSSMIMKNVIITDNTSQYGAGIYFQNSSPNMENITITNNISSENGGGLFLGGTVNTPSITSPILVNSILWNNSPEEIYNSSGTVTATYSDIQGGWEGTGNIDADPIFADTANGNYHLLWNSPCINAGNPDLDGDGTDYFTDTDDQDPDGTRMDMGAYYLHQYKSPLADFTATPTSGQVPLEVQFTDQSVPIEGKITNWTWNFGDGSTSTDEDPIHTYDKYGVYTVSLTVVDDNGMGGIETKEDYITANYSGPVWYVFNDGNDSGQGTIEDPFATIQQAVENASSGDSIMVYPGLYGAVSINNSLFIGSVYFEDIDSTIIGSTQIERIFLAGGAGESTFFGLTISNSDDNYAIQFSNDLAADDSVYVRYCHIINNKFRGIYHKGASLFIENCIINNNGQGIYLGSDQGDPTPTVSISNCEINGNIHPDENGAAIDVHRVNLTINGTEIKNNFGYNIVNWNSYNNESLNLYDSQIIDNDGIGLSTNGKGTTTLENVVIENNTHTGVHNLRNATITNCTISNNKGGGLSVLDNVTISNTTVSGNTLEHENIMQGSYGAGIYWLSNSTLTDVVIKNNHASNGEGGGIYFQHSVENVILENVTITNNTASRGGAIATAGGPIEPNDIIFSETTKCNIYENYAISGTDIWLGYTGQTLNIVVDTFTVATPTDYYAYPLSNITFDIENHSVDPIVGDIYVDPTGSNDNSGTSSASPFKNIYYGLLSSFANSSNPGTIHLADGTYSPSTNGEFFPLGGKDYVSIIGTSQGGTILSGDSSTTIFSGSLNEVLIDNLTITNGDPGMDIYGSGTLSNLSVSDNLGTGIKIRGGDLLLENLTVNNNQKSGIKIEGAVHLRNSEIFNNSDEDGYAGGVHINGNQQDGVLIENCNIYGNSAHTGGGLYLRGYATIVNCNIVNNFAYNASNNYSGGVFIHSGTHRIFNSIIRNNSQNDIVFLSSNTASNVSFGFNDISGGQNDIIAYEDDTINWLAGNIDIHPLFVDSLNGDYHLKDQSLLIGAGIDSIEISDTWYYAPSTDITGNNRPNPSGSKPDIGAYENIYGESQHNTLIYVSTTGTDSEATFGFPSAPFKTIQAAIDYAVDADTVIVKDGEYSGTVEIQAKQLTFGSSMIIDSDTSHISKTIINGHIFFGSSDTPQNIDTISVIKGFTINSNHLQINYAPITIQNLIIKNSTETGIIYVGLNVNTYLKVFDTIVENHSRQTGSTFGGGIGSTNGKLYIKNSIIRNNTATYGGGISLHGSAAKIENTLIAGNTSTSSDGGAGIHILGRGEGITTLTNVTIANNTNTGQGRGGGIKLNNSTVDIKNSIFWGNSGYQIDESSNSSFKDTVRVSYSIIENGTSGIKADEEQIDGWFFQADPLFYNIQNDDYDLTFYSHAIDAGDPDLDGDGITWETDEDDQDPDGTRMDMGAFYFDKRDNKPPTVTITGPSNNNLKLGTKHNIAWTTTDNFPTDTIKIKLEYSTNFSSGVWTKIADSLANTGTYEWSVPDIPSANGGIKITATDFGGNTAADSSGKIFEIYYPSVTLQSLSNTTVKISEIVPIEWSTASVPAVQSVDLYYTVDDGVNWKDLSLNENNDFEYWWSVPNEPTTTAGIRIVAKEQFGYKDTADVKGLKIEIEYPTVTSVNPNQDNIWWDTKDIKFKTNIIFDSQTVNNNSVILTNSQADYGYSVTQSNDTITVKFASTLITYDSISIKLDASKIKSPFGYGLDGNGDGTPGDDYTIIRKVYMPIDYDYSGTITASDVSLFVDYFKTNDSKWEPAPIASGTVPYVVIAPDGKYDIDDMLTFVQFGNWYLQGASGKVSEDIGNTPISLDTTIQSKDYTVSFSKSTKAIEVYVKYDPLKLTPIIEPTSGEIKLGHHDTEKGIISLIVYNPSGENIRLKWNQLDKKSESDISVLVKTTDQNGQETVKRTMLKVISVPSEFALHDNYPNPFNPTTTFRFDVPEVSDVTLSIYNMLGQRVRTFNYQNTSAGYHSVTWDATNDYGEQVGAGVYLYQLRAKQFVKTRKMVLLK